MKGQAGLHSDASDYMAISGETPEIAGFYLTYGFSDSGFMHPPAVGRLIADLILRGGTFLPNAHSLAFDRFHLKVQQRESTFI